ncbi:MAG: GntR family transcriptional regulator [Victivallales bacterium]
MKELDPNSSIPLYLQLRKALCHQILTGDRSEYLPREVDLCRRYGVSRRTVARAMALLVSDGIVQRIKRKGTLIRLRPEKSLEGRIGLVFPISNQWETLLQGMHDTAAKSGCSLIIFPYDWFNLADERRALMIASSSSDGLIVYPNAEESDRSPIADLHDVGYPIVLLDLYFDDCDCSYVGMDNFLCACKLTEALIQKPSDRIGIIHVAVVKSQISVRQRVAGFHKTLEQHQIKFDESMELILHSRDRDENLERISSFLKNTSLDGVFVTSQYCYPWHNLDSLDFSRLRVSTVGSRQYYSSRLNLNYAELPEEEIGHMAIELLKEKINAPSSRSKRIQVAPIFHWRQEKAQLQSI